MGSSDGTVQKKQVTDGGHRVVIGAKIEVRTRIPNQLFEDASGPSSTSKQIPPNTTFIHHKYMHVCNLYTLYMQCGVLLEYTLVHYLYVLHRYSVTQWRKHWCCPLASKQMKLLILLKCLTNSLIA